MDMKSIAVSVAVTAAVVALIFRVDAVKKIVVGEKA